MRLPPEYQLPDSDPPPPAKPDWLMIGLLVICAAMLMAWLIVPIFWKP